MEGIRCCVCHRYFGTEEIRFLGDRPFCEEHAERALEATETDWTRSGIIEALLLAAFVGAVAAIWNGEMLPTNAGIGFALAAIPAALFLVFIYRQDRIEPEPMGLVLGVFALGGLLCWGAVVPLEHQVFAVGEWEHRGGLAPWVSSVGVSGTLHMLAVFVAVRYTVFQTTEFDEPIDGVVYAVAAGLGLATVDNIAFVVQHDHVLPLAGAAAIANTTLIDVAASAILGFGLSRLRFEKGSTPVFVVTFLWAAALHGGLHELVIVAGTRGATFDPLLAFGVTLGMSLVVLVGAQRMAVHFAREQLADAEAAPIEEEAFDVA
ncbi:MAG: PrsW family intramembrane metalloprotease [Deltaproteobacteria bacterium]|nr:PrsW family intramembrane metalloprotease [Deltaproteobacteria bacterium]